MIGIIGKKIGMTQVFTAEGLQVPCTVVEAQPNPVLQVSEPGKMSQIQLGLGTQRVARASKKGERTPRGRRANKAVVGHAAKAGLDAPPAVLRTVRLDDGPKS